jgi:catechol 2,3-dioxygenase-like lactoylglutathione lyase family enzyme
MEREAVKTAQALKAHVAINVGNVERSTEFYKKMLGLEPSKTRRGYAKFDVMNPPLNLTLNESKNVERGALSHMGIQVASTDDVLAIRENWINEGLITRDEMQTNCCYALQDKTWVRDPDGNEWEVFVVLEDNLAETSACCNGAEAAEQVEAAGSCATSTQPVSEASSCCEATAAPVAISK